MQKNLFMIPRVSGCCKYLELEDIKKNYSQFLISKKVLSYTYSIDDYLHIL